MFRVGSAAMFLVNRPCIARHRGGRLDARQAKTVIAGLDPAFHRDGGNPL
jgi:hypothetical protein